MSKQHAGKKPVFELGQERAAQRKMILLSSGDLVGAKVFFRENGVGRMIGGPVRKAAGLCKDVSSNAASNFVWSGNPHAGFGAAVCCGVPKAMDQ